MRTQYDLENDELMNSYIRRRYLKKRHEVDWDDIPSVEFTVTSACDLKCTYCYLKNFEEELYPAEIRHPKQILENAEKLLDYLLKEDYIFNIDVFSGEIFSQKLGYDLFDLIYEKLKNANGNVQRIMVPTNMNFILDDTRTEKVKEILKKFDEIGVIIHLSASFDGHFLLENRPFVNGKEVRDEVYYDRLFTFIKNHRVGLHPMVSARNIDKWIDNYDWYVSMLEKYDIRYLHSKFYGEIVDIMMLEVRNNDWDSESIKHLLKFLNHIIDYRLERYGHDKERYLKWLLEKHLGYNNVSLDFRAGDYDKISCNLQGSLYVRLGDLSIVPCHRLMYDHYKLGRFVCDEEGKIDHIESTNVPLFLTLNQMKSNNMQKCVHCAYKGLCMKGCLGCQYEENKDMFHPIDSVCRMLKSKITFLIEKYEKIGLLEEICNRLSDAEVAIVRQIQNERSEDVERIDF